MLQENFSQLIQNKKKAYAFAVILAMLVILPVFAMAGRGRDVYVDTKANGTQDGSKSHPYKTIKQAADRAGKRTKIHVANGTYRENIELKDGVNLYGHDKDSVIIDAKSDDKATVVMKDDTRIDNVTIKNGKYGIKIADDEEASITECIIKDNDEDGIHIENAGLKKSTTVTISKNEINENGRAGIYSEKRKLTIIDNEIANNESNGIDLEKSANAWIANNEIKGNSGSGMKLRIDGSNIWTKNNTFRNNDHEGLEVYFSGAYGRINVAKADFIKNERNGVARIQDFAISVNSEGLWNKYLTFENNNTFSQNKKADIAGVIIKK